MGKIKTECRNHLERDTLKDLLQIMLEGPQLQYFFLGNAMNVLNYRWLNTKPYAPPSKKK